MAYVGPWQTRESAIIRGISVRDVRFPTSHTHLWNMCHDDVECHCEDRSHDYSCTYVIIYADIGIKGYGMVFTLGKGTDLVCEAVKHLSPILVGQKLTYVFNDFASFWKKLAGQSHLKWLGPEKGVVHMALSAIVNALWDLWGRMCDKPVWKLLLDMEPEKLVSTIDFSYINDTVTPEECIAMLKDEEGLRERREHKIVNEGYPAYSSHAGAECLSNDKMSELLNILHGQGFNRFKLKIGLNKDENIRRCQLFRDKMGWETTLILDFNQLFGSLEAIEMAKELIKFKPLWIEEPTSADDVHGHLLVRQFLRPLGVQVATGEHCYNRVMFKQFMMNDAADCYLVDPSRLGGINEILAILFMAKKFKKTVIPHTGGIALCQLAQHLAIFNHVAFGTESKGRMMEYVENLKDHFVFPLRMRKGYFIPPVNPGLSGELIEKSAKDYEYPLGRKWREMFQSKEYSNPMNDVPPYIRRSRSFIQ